MEDTWVNYPEEILEQAIEANNAAEEAFNMREVPDPDPYNVSFVELVSRWWDRRYG